MQTTAAKRPTLDTGRLICVDGPAGAGKTTFAAELAKLSGAPVVHVDDLLDGWGGLADIGSRLEALLRPLALGHPGCYDRYDWELGRFTSTVIVRPAPLLVVEGVGCGQASYAPLITTLVWVGASAPLRLQRGLARDGTAMEASWRQWMVDEERLFELQGTTGRLDVLVDGTGERPAHVIAWPAVAEQP